MKALEWIGWIVLTLVIAFVVHVASVRYLPHAIMHIAMDKMGAVNEIHHGRRVDEASRGVVRPSPDLLYSSCPFDLSKGTLEVKAPVPPGTYWSVSAFDTETNNFFALNDRQIGGQPLELILLPTHGGQEPAMHIAGQLVVRAPTERGLILFRTLINDDRNFATIDAIRRQATCALQGGARGGTSGGG